MAATRSVERRSGVALWRQIADDIRRGLAAGTLAPSGRLPPEIDLAQRFGVNRHTVRGAIAALVQEGVLRSEQGRGTFVEERRRFAYPIGPRTRFSEGLEGQARELRSRLLGHAVETTSTSVAEALEIAPGAAVLRLETTGEADGRPVSRATSFLDAARFPGFVEAYRESGSITAAFAASGVRDYLRRSTLVSARHADAADVTDLRLSPGAVVLVTLAVNVDTEGRPIQYSETRFAADRVELTILNGS